jgi:hypothetical protein
MGILTAADQAENFLFRGGDWDHNKDDPYELMERVRDGVKPVADIVVLNDPVRLRAARRRFRSEVYMTPIVRNEWGVDVIMVCKSETATLADYWDLARVMDAYRNAKSNGVDDIRQAFNQTIVSLLPELRDETLRISIIGLLYGYPVSETIELLKRAK